MNNSENVISIDFGKQQIEAARIRLGMPRLEPKPVRSDTFWLLAGNVVMGLIAFILYMRRG